MRLNVAHAYQIGSLHDFCRSRQQPTQFPLVSLRRFDRRRLISDLHTGTPTGGILVPALRSPAQRVAPAGVQNPPFPRWEYSQIQGQRLCGRERGIWKCEAAGLGFYRLEGGRGSGILSTRAQNVRVPKVRRLSRRKGVLRIESAVGLKYVSGVDRRTLPIARRHVSATRLIQKLSSSCVTNNWSISSNLGRRSCCQVWRMVMAKAQAASAATQTSSRPARQWNKALWKVLRTTRVRYPRGLLR